MTGNFLDVFEKSEYADSIYYADLFRIDNKIWMIMGHGKSDAARLASNRIEEDDLARDSVAIKVKNNILFAKCDFGAVRKDKVIFDFHEVDNVIYCLSPDETLVVYNNEQKIIKKTNVEFMAVCSSIFIYPGVMAQHFFSDEEFENLENTERRINKFKEIVSQANNCKLLLMPYMNTLEEKAELYKSTNLDIL